MGTKMSILFYGKKAKTTKEGMGPIYLRVTIEGKRFEVSTSMNVERSKWIASAGKVKGNSEKDRTINAHLDTLKHKAFDYRRELIVKEQPFNIDTFKCKWLGVDTNQHTVMQMIRDHNGELEKLVGKGYVRATVVKYRTTEKHVEEFIR